MRRNLISAIVTAAIAAFALISVDGASAYTLGTDGETAAVSSYASAIRERVYIPQPGIDQDGDGVADTIAVEIIRPAESGPGNKVPAIIDPSPYYTTLCRGNESECIGDTNADGINDKWPLFLDNYFVPRGYAVIYAESNGTGNSTGCPLHGGPDDIAGMKSVIDWLNGRATGKNGAGATVTASWHNGKAAMIGKSYDGTLTNGVAATGVDGLTTIVPESAISDWYLYSRLGGIRARAAGAHYPASLSSAITNTDRRTTPCLASRNAMSAADDDATGDRNLFWDARDYLPNVGNVKASVLLTHGLQDDNVTTNQFATWWAGLAAHNVPRKLWLLREGHVDPFDSRRAQWVDTLHRWFDYWLYGIQNGIMNEPRVDIEDDKDVWHTYSDWPLPSTQDTSVYLRGLTDAGPGALGLSSGGDLATVSFTDAPNQTETTMVSNASTSQVNRRVFLSQPLTHDLRISGTPQVELTASLSTTQSNLGAVVVDYSPSAVAHIQRNEGISNGTTQTCWGQDPPAGSPDHNSCYLEVTKPTTNVTTWRVTRGELDSSNRSSLYVPSLVTAGQMTPFEWPLQPNDYVFKTGDQIGVVVVGDYRDIGFQGTANATITLDTKLSKLTLPIVGGYTAALQSGAFAPDTVAPAQIVPSDVVVDPTDDSGATVTYPAPGVSDNEDPAPTSSCDPASGSHFPKGKTTVTCTARDASGNTTVGTFTITVTGAEEPTPPQDQIPAPPAPTGGDTPVPPQPTGTAGDGGPPSPEPPTLDTIDKLAPQFAALHLAAGRRSLKVSFKLDEAATVTVAVYGHGAKKPLKTAKARLAKGKRSVTVKSSKLKPGTYTVKLTAVDAAGNARHVTKTVKIRR